jgi:hypothetical protein
MSEFLSKFNLYQDLQKMIDEFFDLLLPFINTKDSVELLGLKRKKTDLNEKIQRRIQIFFGHQIIEDRNRDRQERLAILMAQKKVYEKSSVKFSRIQWKLIKSFLRHLPFIDKEKFMLYCTGLIEQVGKKRFTLDFQRYEKALNKMNFYQLSD